MKDEHVKIVLSHDRENLGRLLKCDAFWEAMIVACRKHDYGDHHLPWYTAWSVPAICRSLRFPQSQNRTISYHSSFDGFMFHSAPCTWHCSNTPHCGIAPTYRPVSAPVLIISCRKTAKNRFTKFVFHSNGPIRKSRSISLWLSRWAFQRPLCIDLKLR